MPVGGGGLSGSPGAVTHALQADFSGTAFGGSPTWTDITAWWMSAGSDPGGQSVTIPWGRQDQSTTVESSTTSFVLNNADGRFTPGNTGLRNNLLAPDVASPGHLTGSPTGKFTTTAPASLFIWNAAAGSTGVFADDSDVCALGVNIPNGFGGPATAIEFMTTGVAVTAGQVYTAAVEINNGTTTAGAYGQLRFLNGSGVDVGDFAGNVIAAGQRGYSKVTATAPAGAVTAVVLTYLNAAQSSGVTKFVYLDNFSIESGSAWSGETAAPYYPNVKRRVRMRETITDGTTTLVLFDGYVDSWTVTPQTNGPTLATVSLSDGFSRLSASTTLRAMVVEEMLLDGPTAFYPLDEAESSTTAGDISGNAAASATVKNSKYGSGTVTFGAPLGFADAQTGVALSGGVSSTVSHGSWLEVPGVSLPSSAAFSLEVFFVGPSSASGTAMTLVMQSVSSHAGNVGLLINGAGVLSAFIPAPHGGASELDGTTNVCDGRLHHVAMTLTSDRKTLTIYLDGASEATYTNVNTFDWTNSGEPFQLGMFYQLNPYQITWPFNGTYGPFAVYRSTLSAARVAAHHTAALTAFAGESTATRFARLATYRPNLGATTTGTVGTVGPGDIAGMSIGDAFTDVATAEGGVIQTNRGTTSLIGRANWYDPATTLTLNAANGEVDLPTTWRDDTQGLVNDVTVSRPNGAPQRVVNTASTTGADGVAQTSISANLNSDRDAADMAGWLVAVGIVEQIDSPTLTVNLYARSSATLTMAVCALKTYDVVTLTNLPASAPATTMSFQVQGGTYTVGADTFTAELYTTVMPPTTLRADATADAYTLLDSGLVFSW